MERQILHIDVNNAFLSWTASSTKLIYEKAKNLLSEMLKDKKLIRLVGIRVDNLIEKDHFCCKK